MNKPSKHPHDDRSLLERLVNLISPGPDNKPELYQFLQQARERQIIDAEGLAMIEGVIQITELTARDIMIPRSQIDMLNTHQTTSEIISYAVSKSHSRFPVYEDTLDNVIGILLAKDLLPAHYNKQFNWQDCLRPALFIPESQPLNMLLRDFRLKKNHLALVVDEFSQIVGLITIEDVIEQIIGDIEDEYDFDEGEAHIISTGQDQNEEWRLNALTDLTYFNTYFNTDFSHPHAETIGGYITQAFGRMPHKGEHLIIENFRFEVLKADGRQLHILKLRKSLPENL